MKKLEFNYLVNLILFIQFVLVGGTGLVIYFNPNGGGHLLSFIHNQVGVLMLVFFIAHMTINWKWVVATTKKFSKKEKGIKKNYIVDLALFIQFVLVGGTGLIMYLNHRAGGQILRLIHDQIGILMLVFFTVHVVLHWKWIAGTTKKLSNNTYAVGRSADNF